MVFTALDSSAAILGVTAEVDEWTFVDSIEYYSGYTCMR